MRSIVLTAAAAILIGLVGGKIYFQTNLYAAPVVEPTTLALVETLYKNGQVTDVKNILTYVSGFQRTVKTVFAEKITLLRMWVAADDGKLHRIDAWPELGVRVTMETKPKSEVASLQNTYCGGDKSLRKNIQGYETYAFEVVTPVPTPEGENAFEHVYQEWRSPALGCLALELTVSSRFPDGTNEAIKSMVLASTTPGVPEGVFEVKDTWQEVSADRAVELYEQHTRTPVEFEKWRVDPAVQEYLTRLNQTYHKNRAKHGIVD